MTPLLDGVAPALAVAALALGAAGCSDDAAPTVSPSPATRPACTESIESRRVDDADPGYRVVAPNGGEVWVIGQPCTVRVTSMTPGEAEVQLLIGGEAIDIPGNTRALATPTESTIVLDLPALVNKSVYDPTLGIVRDSAFALASDSCRILVFDYKDRSYSDVSDCCFAIVRP